MWLKWAQWTSDEDFVYGKKDQNNRQEIFGRRTKKSAPRIIPWEPLQYWPSPSQWSSWHKPYFDLKCLGLKIKSDQTSLNDLKENCIFFLPRRHHSLFREAAKHLLGWKTIGSLKSYTLCHRDLLLECLLFFFSPGKFLECASTVTPDYILLKKKLEQL